MDKAVLEEMLRAMHGVVEETLFTLSFEEDIEDQSSKELLTTLGRMVANHRDKLGWRECSVCRRWHGSEIVHPCE